MEIEKQLLTAAIQVLVEKGRFVVSFRFDCMRKVDMLAMDRLRLVRQVRNSDRSCHLSSDDH